MQVVSTLIGRMQQQTTCPTCGGTGQQVEAFCGSCDGRGVVQRAKTLKVNIPKGVDSGQRLRVRSEGNAAPKGGQPGDLYVFITVQDDKTFRREGIDIYTEMAVSYVDAILGRRLKVPTIDGEVEIELPAGTQPGTTLRIEGKGVPKLNAPDTRGNQFIKVIVQIPKKLSPKEREAVLKLDELGKKPS
jgi:molecular chaperone DnaJ